MVWNAHCSDRTKDQRPHVAHGCWPRSTQGSVNALMERPASSTSADALFSSLVTDPDVVFDIVSGEWRSKTPRAGSKADSSPRNRQQEHAAGLESMEAVDPQAALERLEKLLAMTQTPRENVPSTVQGDVGTPAGLQHQNQNGATGPATKSTASPESTPV